MSSLLVPSNYVKMISEFSLFNHIPFHCWFIVIKYIDLSESEMCEINWIVSLVRIN